MATPKMPGITRPCRKRQKISMDSDVAVEARSVGMASSSVAMTMTRLRPARSATSPQNGAERATPIVAALTVIPTAAFEAAKTRPASAAAAASRRG